MNTISIPQLIFNILLGLVGFLSCFFFKQIEADLKSVSAQIVEVQLQLRELQVKQESYVTEARVREIIKEYHK